MKLSSPSYRSSSWRMTLRASFRADSGRRSKPSPVRNHTSPRATRPRTVSSSMGRTPNIATATPSNSTVNAFSEAFTERSSALSGVSPQASSSRMSARRIFRAITKTSCGSGGTTLAPVVSSGGTPPVAGSPSAPWPEPESGAIATHHLPREAHNRHRQRERLAQHETGVEVRGPADGREDELGLEGASSKAVRRLAVGLIIQLVEVLPNQHSLGLVHLEAHVRHPLGLQPGLGAGDVEGLQVAQLAFADVRQELGDAAGVDDVHREFSPDVDLPRCDGVRCCGWHPLAQHPDVRPLEV